MTCPGSPIVPSAVGCRTVAELTGLQLTCWCCGRTIQPVHTAQGVETPPHNLPAEQVGQGVLRISAR